MQLEPMKKEFVINGYSNLHKLVIPSEVVTNSGNECIYEAVFINRKIKLHLSGIIHQMI
jgi:hypothetical protein